MLMASHDFHEGAEELESGDIERMLRDTFGNPESAFLGTLNQVRDSLRAMADEQRETRSEVRGMSERLIRLEERDKRMEAIEGKADRNSNRLTELEGERNRRDGATGALNWLLKWGPTLLGLFTAIYLVARAVGVLHLPSDEPRTVIPDAHVVIHGTAPAAQGAEPGK